MGVADAYLQAALPCRITTPHTFRRSVNNTRLMITLFGSPEIASCHLAVSEGRRLTGERACLAHAVFPRGWLFSIQRVETELKGEPLTLQGPPRLHCYETWPDVARRPVSLCGAQAWVRMTSQRPARCRAADWCCVPIPPSNSTIKQSNTLLKDCAFHKLFTLILFL